MGSAHLPRLAFGVPVIDSDDSMAVFSVDGRCHFPVTTEALECVLATEPLIYFVLQCDESLA